MDNYRDSYFSGISENQTLANNLSCVEQYTFDEALEKVGASNKYQYRAFVYFGLQWFFANWILMSPIYIFSMPSLNCHDNLLCQSVCLNTSTFTSQDDCMNKFICLQSAQDQLTYLDGKSLVTAFGNPLICSRANIRDLLSSTPYAGSLFGFFLFSFLADNYGRKLGIGLAWLSASIGSVILGLSQNFEMVGIGMFLLGFGINPAITIQYSLFNEHTLGKFRDIQNIGVQIFYGFAEIILVFVAYYFQDWRIITLCWFSIPIVLMNLGILLIFESPRFVYAKNKQKAVKILNKIAAVNGMEPIQSAQLQNCKNNKLNNSRVYTIMDLLKFRSLRGKFLCGLLLMFSLQSVYYGISFAMDGIGLNLYYNAFIIACFETASFIVADHQIHVLPRKKTVLIGSTIACVFSFLFVILKKPEDCGNICSIVIIQIVMAGCIRFVISFVMAVTYTYIPELFPTAVRSLAMGLISGAGTIGSVICPYVITFSKQLKISPLISLGFIGLFSLVAAFPMKETLNEPLPEGIEEELVGAILTDEKNSSMIDQNNLSDDYVAHYNEKSKTNVSDISTFYHCTYQFQKDKLLNQQIKRQSALAPTWQMIQHQKRL